jgi:hypothetical protein
MATTKRVRGPQFDSVAGVWRDGVPTLPTITTGHGFGSLLGPGQNPSSGRQDRDLHRFDGKKGPRGTNESLPANHGAGEIGGYGGVRGFVD